MTAGGVAAATPAGGAAAGGTVAGGGSALVFDTTAAMPAANITVAAHPTTAAFACVQNTVRSAERTSNVVAAWTDADLALIIAASAGGADSKTCPQIASGSA